MMKSWEQIEEKTITNIIGNMWGKQNPSNPKKIYFQEFGDMQVSVH